MPVLKPARPASQLHATQPVTDTNDIPLPTSTAGATSQYQDSELEADPTSLVHPLEEEGEVSEQETGILEHDHDRQISEEQNYREMVGEVRSYMA